ncbi:response regulator receiver domain [Enterobacter sp. I4]|uniref:response regulator receiver domain n=1 Tax=Enterobacter TaxID=547 RepID=UPI001F581F43|nr:response regulator receiver domain [Enterobacter sp. I4]MCI2294127.1 response regulator receiver domain [Enterobacter sp. I4]
MNNNQNMQSPEFHKIKWGEHIQGAVKKFLKTAVIIDNQPWIRMDAEKIKTNENDLRNTGMDGDMPQLTAPEIVTSSGAHDLDLRAISDVFSEKGIACAFVLPDDANKDKQQKLNRAINAAKVSDIVVIDWYLESKSAALTLEVLEEIAKSDSAENGRLRLICIYTGEPLTDNIFNDVIASLKKGGIDVDRISGENFCAHSKSTIITLKNKNQLPASSLPEALIQIFSRFANGLIPSFALAAIGAIRNNTHHMLTRFSANIDAAYVSNRLITNPPGDVAELMRELMVSECDNALGLERIADDYLESKTITKWLNYNQEKIKPLKYQDKDKEIHINLDFISSLLKNGINDNDFMHDDGSRIAFPEKKRDLLSVSLTGSELVSKKCQNEFSKLVAFRRESTGSTTRLMNPEWLPSLTTGTILSYINNEKQKKYLMCFTPACDTLRMSSSRPFVFIEGSAATSKKYNLVISSENGEDIGVFFDKRNPIVRTYSFSPDKETQRVRACKKEKKYIFSDNNIDFEWIGEIRYSRATSEMASIANNWMRIGIIDSEYLRLASKGHFKF